MESHSTPPNLLSKIFVTLRQAFDADYHPHGTVPLNERSSGVAFARCVPFIFLHAGCLGVIWTGWSWTAVGIAAALYFVRMFAITGFYHRYFSHRSFHTSRVMQFFFAVVGNASAQRGALWWASTHRHHHKHSDEEEDAHSPRVGGFWWSHLGWLTSNKHFATDYSAIRDLAKFPELVFLNRFDWLVPALLGGGLYGLGALLERFAPGLGTNGWQIAVWGFFISTVVLLHGTLCINSLAHVLGGRRFNTKDDSRNNLFLALITLGEGWHNNHHRYMSSARQGFYWWEIDITYYLLKLLSFFGLIWDLREVPAAIYAEAKSGMSAQVEESA
jgi:stearoyl-CoA desaturase (delta-9 desaturase)